MSSTWKPSEGMRRAQPIVAQLAEDGAANDNPLSPLLQHRMVSVIGSAIDQALGDGLAKPAAAANGHGEFAYMSDGIRSLTDAEYKAMMPLRTTTDAADDAARLATDNLAAFQPLPYADPYPSIVQDREEDAKFVTGDIPAPKKRGRPPGPAKAKKAKTKGKRGRPRKDPTAAVEAPVAQETAPEAPPAAEPPFSTEEAVF